MRSLCQLVVLALPLLSRVAGEEPTEPSSTKQTEKSPQTFYKNANEAFQDLLDALPEESLHAALNSLAHFRVGIFESDRHGVARVHQQNPPLATKLIVAAVQDLKKRQAPAPSNGTSPAPTTQAPPPQSSNPVPTLPQSTNAPAPPPTSAVIIPITVETTDAAGHTTVVSSAELSQPTASVAVPVTQTNAAGSTEVTIETKPAVIYTATDSAGSASLITSAVEYAPTPGQVQTRTNSQGSKFVTTYTPGSGKIRSIVLITTTGPDGRRAVITSYTYVDPQAATATDASSPTDTAKPSLQKGAAMRPRVVDTALMGGALGGALAFLV